MSLMKGKGFFLENNGSKETIPNVFVILYWILMRKIKTVTKDILGTVGDIWIVDGTRESIIIHSHWMWYWCCAYGGERPDL